MEDLQWMGAADAACAMRAGALAAEALMAACLSAVDARETELGAWAFLDPDYARGRARHADELRTSGRALGPLHGVPVGIKDIIDTEDMPTEHGTVLHAGRRPARDAAVVRMLRLAGAVVMGKTVTTELATYAPGKTRNPHDPAHTPGGSSSGSAAAVAAGMVPLAIGTQTNGSVIRPAAFCGVFGFKPSFGLVPRSGVLRQSPALDTVGVFARSLDDIALCMECIAGCDAGDPATKPLAVPRFLDVARAAPPLRPTLAFVRTPAWDRAEPQTVAAFDELLAALNAAVQEHALADGLRAAWSWHRAIMEADIASSYAHEYERGRDLLSESLRAQIERGRRIPAIDYIAALDRIAWLNRQFEPVFDRFDAILTAAAPGTAPAGLASTGDPAFCTLWTLCGMPALSLPLMRGSDGLPLGVQLVGRRGDDARLLRTARWLLGALREDVSSDAVER
jgi:Asp-tRNA(Asn)/Glu-tRNA(Gln) amidotransferase A subunit family amidase